MRTELVNPFISSFINVLRTMAEIEMLPQKPQIKGTATARGDISSLIDLIDDKAKGSFSITFDESLAFDIMDRMLGERPDELNDDVSDMVGEITNMVTGGAKRQLSEEGLNFKMASPVVVMGKDHFLEHKAKGDTIIIPFDSKFGHAYLEVCFDG